MFSISEDGFPIGVCFGFHGLKVRGYLTSRLPDAIYMDIIKTEGLKAPGYLCSRLPDVFSFP